MARVAGLVLAAGRSTRFGSPKALATLDGRPMLEHILGTAAATGLDPIVVVLGDDAEAIEAAIDWHGERLVRNPDPGRGLASSLRVGLAPLVDRKPAGGETPIDAVVILLGDQPWTRAVVIEALLARRATADRPILVPRYAAGGGRNPVLLDRSAFELAMAATGDRGLGPLVGEQPELVEWVDVQGENPDIDTPADLAEVALRMPRPTVRP